MVETGLFYSIVIDPILKSMRRRVAFEINHEHNVIDVACGTGAQAIEIAQYAKHVVGIDISESMISQAKKEAIDLAMSFHSAPQYCSDIAKKLHGRNSFQVLGANLNDPVKFVICWTPDGCLSHSTRTRASGGTGTAISIASANNIPIFNLQRKEHFDRLNNWTNK